jgi:eIF-2B alpha/beta/delta-like uncharacterized protein
MNNSFKISYRDLILPDNIKNKIKKIKSDNISGSIELSTDAAEVLIFLVENYDIDSSLELINLINKTAYELIKAQPSMASIFNLGNIITLSTSNLRDIDKIKENLNKICQKFIENLKLSMKQISKTALKLLDDDITIITHSYSSTLLNTLVYAKKFGFNIKIICTESRPMNEGVKLASLLGKKGLEVKLVVDSCIYSFLQESDMIFVGADSISLNGIINKIGTCGLAISAKHYKKKFYVLCSLDKILPKEYQLIYKYKNNPREIISNSIKNVEAVNYYFDLTPLEFIDGFVSERGVLSKVDIQDIINNIKINKNLIN